jgi:predicted transcriptional regulator
LSEKDILGWLKISFFRDVARALEKSPMSTSEVAKMVNLSEKSCDEILYHLESSQAVEYAGSRWKLTELGQRVLDKYFK